MAHPFVLAAAIATFASGPGGAPPLVQAVKSICKASASDAVRRPAVCRGGGPLTARVACFCPAGGIKVDLPACWQDGRPAMHKPGRDLSAREYDSLVACEDLGRH